MKKSSLEIWKIQKKALSLYCKKDTDIMKLKKVNASELHEMLCKGTVKFQFTKKDGTVRTAVGTLKSDLITKKPTGGENKVEGAGYTTYFDLEKDAFRCFAESKLIGVVED